MEVPRELCARYGAMHIHSKDLNFKFHGRFVLPLLCDTEYAAVFDDDTVPGARWLENCLRASRAHEAIVGANGRTLLDPQHMGADSLQVGDGFPVERDTQVDFVGHAWFFKSAWVRCLWVDRPVTWDNGEDIHLAAACSLYAGIPCVVPRMPEDDRSLWGDTRTDYGNDDVATWKSASHGELRAEVVRAWVDKGWVPLLSRPRS